MGTASLVAMCSHQYEIGLGLVTGEMSPTAVFPSKLLLHLSSPEVTGPGYPFVTPSYMM